MIKRIILCFFACIVTSEAAEYSLYLVNDSSSFAIRKHTMNTTFPELSWDKPGLYLFLERKYLQLFYFDDSNKIEYYQYPRQRKSKWLEPEAFLKEREKISTGNWTSQCHSRIDADVSVVKETYDLHMETFPEIVAEDANDFVKDLGEKKNNEVLVYIGMKIDESGKHFFVFKRLFRDDVKRHPLDLYARLYRFFEKQPFTLMLEECKQ